VRQLATDYRIVSETIGKEMLLFRHRKNHRRDEPLDREVFDRFKAANVLTEPKDTGEIGCTHLLLMRKFTGDP
jgi:hypothetical protein